MYLGRRHAARIELRQVLAFTCKRCKYRCDASVVATGRGDGHSPFFLDNAGAAERAMERAEADGRGNLLETLALARCPQCNARDVGAHAWSIFKAVLATAAVGAGTLAIGWRVAWTGRVVLAVAGALALATFALLQRARVTAARRVTFPPVPTKPRVSVPAASLPPPGPPAPTRKPERDPYRAAPAAAAIQPIQTIRAAVSPVDHAASDVDQPKLLK